MTVLGLNSSQRSGSFAFVLPFKNRMLKCTEDETTNGSQHDAKLLVMRRYSFKAWKLKFWLRLFAMFDVLFAPKFELTTYRKDGSQSAKTKFDKAEIDNAGRHGLL